MHSMGKSIVELHAMLKHHEKGISKKAETPVVLAIREGKIQKDRKNRKGQRQRTLSATTARRGSLEEELLGLRESRKLKHGALSLYVGNGMRADVEAIGSFDLILPRYPKEKMGYYFYIPLENKIFVARNAEFFKNNLMVQEASGSHGHLESIEPQNVEVPIRRSARIPQAPDRYGFYVDVEKYELGDLDEPPNYKAALSYPESDK
ncbi:hypothetical protein Tco_1081089 [Tanacetum coccineum]|uniref:Zinc finger, CCHC-type n=1 Tax=Tanacetum coccineum TaxID=301880 RepID=A0ABQ5HWP6_9ASTR